MLGRWTVSFKGTSSPKTFMPIWFQVRSSDEESRCIIIAEWEFLHNTYNLQFLIDGIGISRISCVHQVLLHMHWDFYIFTYPSPDLTIVYIPRVTGATPSPFRPYIKLGLRRKKKRARWPLRDAAIGTQLKGNCSPSQHVILSEIAVL